jgi:flagellar hook-length control protein FliK
MSRAVSGVFGTSTATPSSYGTGKSNDVSDDGSSFSNALDRAQSNGSADTDQSSAASASDSKATAPKAAKQATGRKTAGRKSATETEGDQSKVQKKTTGQTAQDVESDPGQGEAEGGTEEQGAGTAKQQKKSASTADSVPTDLPAAIVQLQGGTIQNGLPARASSPNNRAAPTKAAEPVATAKATAVKADGSPARDPVSEQHAADPGDGEASAGTDGEESPLSNASASGASARAGKTRLAIQPKNGGGTQEASGSPSADAAVAQQAALATTAAPPDDPTTSQISPIGPAVPSARIVRKGPDDLLFQSVPQQATTSSAGGAAAASDASDVDDAQSSPESQFADANHPRIVSGITGQMLPNGGTMQLRLDPPELGAIQVRVEMHNGVMTASFETSNDQASRLLSHSLGDLRSALEAQGVSVQKLQVSQSPKQQSSSGDAQKDGSQTPQDTASHQEQQRKEMVRRMWQKLMGGQDPVDLVA